MCLIIRDFIIVLKFGVPIKNDRLVLLNVTLKVTENSSFCIWKIWLLTKLLGKSGKIFFLSDWKIYYKLFPSFKIWKIVINKHFF